ncbi:MbcA/ParS/Xre antitoxin family protein [Vibrio genomosp. F10]|uniref:MbcA/ParS/Xre antitoxin family protein n=1 Tax=Vibrio genomosp. F10 TaxID=723171 RepID=UPI0002FB20A7|nr:MbcA/ParS/Xre antitoxin family protein [Vibrio genomosp. F10]OEF04902.1 hypothetical protein A1QI_09860 [Vibrio genomosp. F10 str. 9ZB36]
MDSVTEVRKVALEIFEEEGLADEWLNSPKWFFDGLTAVEMLRMPEGRDAVLGILDRIRYGDFS